MAMTTIGFMDSLAEEGTWNNILLIHKNCSLSRRLTTISILSGV